MMALDEVEYEIKDAYCRIVKLEKSRAVCIHAKTCLSVAGFHVARCLSKEDEREIWNGIFSPIQTALVRIGEINLVDKTRFNIGYIHLILSGLVARGELPVEWHREISVAMSHLRESILKVHPLVRISMFDYTCQEWIDRKGVFGCVGY